MLTPAQWRDAVQILPFLDEEAAPLTRAFVAEATLLLPFGVIGGQWYNAGALHKRLPTRSVRGAVDECRHHRWIPHCLPRT